MRSLREARFAWNNAGWRTRETTWPRAAGTAGRAVRNMRERRGVLRRSSRREKGGARGSADGHGTRQSRAREQSRGECSREWLRARRARRFHVKRRGGGARSSSTPVPPSAGTRPNSRSGPVSRGTAWLRSAARSVPCAPERAGQVQRTARGGTSRPERFRQDEPTHRPVRAEREKRPRRVRERVGRTIQRGAGPRSPCTTRGIDMRDVSNGTPWSRDRSAQWRHWPTSPHCRLAERGSGGST